MAIRTSALLLALLASAAGAPSRARGADDEPAASPGPSEEELARLAPAARVEELTPPQREALSRVVQDEFCYCGCPHTLSGCLREHASCRHAPRMVTLASRLARDGLTHLEILRVLTTYYASFDRAKRAALDVKAFGPPLGDPAAPVTIVEFSDFTCPYCQALRPKLEQFVRSRASRVKLFYKPYPISSHEHAFEAAEAGEWARDQGLFWRMHDALFDHPHALDVDDLANYASQLGADPAGLRKAVEERRNKGRIQASQDEARAAGLTGTPTIYLDGRRYLLPDFSEEGLEFTLEDEEEWLKNGGWARD